MAWYKLLDHEGETVGEVEYVDRHPLSFADAKRRGFRKDEVVYRWKSYDEAFQADPPAPPETRPLETRVVTLVRYKCPGCKHPFYESCRVAGWMACPHCPKSFKAEENQGETLYGEVTVVKGKVTEGKK